MRIQLPSTISAPLERREVRDSIAATRDQTLADALAVMLIDLISVLPGHSRMDTMQQLANRLDDRGRTDNGSGAAFLLGNVGQSLMKIGF